MGIRTISSEEIEDLDDNFTPMEEDDDESGDSESYLEDSDEDYEDIDNE